MPITTEKMSTEDAFDIVFELAEQNVLTMPECVGEPMLEAQVEYQHEALEIVQNYIDTDFNETMPKYTRGQQSDALSTVLDMAMDNVLDADLCDGEPNLIGQRVRQTQACRTVLEHIESNFFTEER